MTTIVPTAMPYTEAELRPHMLLAFHDAITYANENDLPGVILATYKLSQLMQTPETSQQKDQQDTQEDTQENLGGTSLPLPFSLPKASGIHLLDDQIDLPAYFKAAVEMDVYVISVSERLPSRKPGESGESIVHLLLIVEEELVNLQIKAILRLAPRDGRFDPVERHEAAHISPRPV